ncbi:hypothetical protein Tco_1026106, partial [Tanacetum coccineum]
MITFPIPNECRNYPECEICRSYDHSTLGHNRVIQIRGGVLAESSQSNEFSIGRHIREPIWYLDNGCSRSMTGVKSYLHKYVEQPGPKVEEQGEISIEERSKLFVELMNERKKHFARLRAEEQRRKPPTKTQNRNLMSTYLKNMAGYKHTQ